MDKFAIILDKREVELVTDALIMALHTYFCNGWITPEERKELEIIKESFRGIA